MPMARTSGALLLPHVSQFDVDFVIPRVGVDIPVWLDPFLLYKSRDPQFRHLHEQIVTAFNRGVEAVRPGRSMTPTASWIFPKRLPSGSGTRRRVRRAQASGAEQPNCWWRP